jgi:hypothetical protein
MRASLALWRGKKSIKMDSWVCLFIFQGFLQLVFTTGVTTGAALLLYNWSGPTFVQLERPYLVTTGAALLFMIRVLEN